MRAMILAAGYGTRLWPLTIDRAKPAIPFMGKPLVGYVAEYLARFGCREVVVNLHHRPDSVRQALGDGSRFGVRLVYVEEPVILGTSGALDNAKSLLADDTFIVINGKIATDIDLAAALETHKKTDALATLILRPNAARERYSVVEVEDGRVLGFGGMPASDNAGGASRASQRHEQLGRAGEITAPSTVGAGDGGGVRETDSAPLMFTGIQILEPRIFDYIPRGVFSHSTTEVYPQAIARGERVVAHVAAGEWHELSTVQRYLETSLALLKKEGRNVERGAGSVIADGAVVAESVLWEGVRVEAGAQVRRAILGAGVVIKSGDKIENAAVVRAELARDAERPAKGLAGEIHGDNFVAPLPQ
jgi:NDP-sugar pyrophosphorylase family protein